MHARRDLRHGDSISASGFAAAQCGKALPYRSELDNHGGCAYPLLRRSLRQK